MLNLPKTDLTAELTFNDRASAHKFAILYSRKTLMGHSITGSTVKVYNINDATKEWIDSYVNQTNAH